MTQFQGQSVDDPVPTSSQAPKLYWLAVAISGLIAVLVVIEAGVLAWGGKEVPEGILLMGASAVTALAFMLKPTGA